MRWHFRRLGIKTLIFLAIWAWGVVAVVEFSKFDKKQRYFDLKLRAARKAKLAMETIRDYRIEKFIPWDPVADPNNTGMIGTEFSSITTDRGVLSSKLTSTNPNLAALLVELLLKVNLRKGDKIAVALTGSFPALNISLYAAIEALGLQPTIITSLGSSSWGANLEQLTWLDMERVLFEKGIFKIRSKAASLGGRNDIGANLSPDGRKALENAAKRNNIMLLKDNTLEGMISKRMGIYGKANYKAYINIGGGLASLGSKYNLNIIGNGIINKLPHYDFPVKGTLILFAERGVPVINLADIKQLAKLYNFPIAPEPIPPVPTGSVFFRKEYNLLVVSLVLLFYLGLIYFLVRDKR